MFVQFISPGQFVAPFSLRLYVQDVGRADAFDKCALPKTNGYDNSTIQCCSLLLARSHCPPAQGASLLRKRPGLLRKRDAPRVMAIVNRKDPI